MKNSDAYAIDYKGVRIDPYRIIHAYGITHPAQQHAIKKLLRAGKSHKRTCDDIQETIEILQRWQAMLEEDLPTLESFRGILKEPK